MSSQNKSFQNDGQDQHVSGALYPKQENPFY